MSSKAHIYCLDANVLIQAWQKYYSPTFCPDYWNILNELGEKGIIFIPEEVRNEIVVPEKDNEKEDELSKWLRNSTIPILKLDEKVISCWQIILQANPLHKLLVDNIKGRSLADPWVISYAMKMNATVVTKENKDTALNTKRIRIPNVCENMGIRCIDDFDFLRELDFKFSCKLNNS
jgi:predicted nucleic acid-binding protein